MRGWTHSQFAPDGERELESSVEGGVSRKAGRRGGRPCTEQKGLTGAPSLSTQGRAPAQRRWMTGPWAEPGVGSGGCPDEEDGHPVKEEPQAGDEARLGAGGWLDTQWRPPQGRCALGTSDRTCPVQTVRSAWPGLFSGLHLLGGEAQEAGVGWSCKVGRSGVGGDGREVGTLARGIEGTFWI